MSKPRTAIWWIRQDLRLADNPALDQALAGADRVIPLFILDPALLASPYVGEKRLAFLYEGLRALDSDLKQVGSRLLVQRGNPAVVLEKLVAQGQVHTVYAQEAYSPYAMRRDRAAAERIPLHLTPGISVHHPQAVLKDDGAPYTVFTPYSRRWKALPLPGGPIPAPERIPTPASPPGDGLPEPLQLDAPLPFPAGEAEAQRRLEAFTRTVQAPLHAYADLRNRVDLDGTSRLSPYLRFGMLSARQAVHAARQALDAAGERGARKGAETWLNELIWREFYLSILYHFPKVRTRSFRENLQAIPWANDPDDFEAWCRGETGYPIVDAAMRQLASIGWMHNRARMIVASFLTKDLLIDWRWGERWFMQHLVDGDPASNNGGWQWTAGTGTDAAPYFRIFNPILQSKRHDPDGAYIRRWVPELRSVPGVHIHTPWEMPEEVQRQAGCVIGKDYPGPIVDHAWARQRTLEAYKSTSR